MHVMCVCTVYIISAHFSISRLWHLTLIGTKMKRFKSQRASVTVNEEGESERLKARASEKDCVIDVKSNKNADKRQTMNEITKNSNHQTPEIYVFGGRIYTPLPVRVPCTLIVFNRTVFQFTCASFG